MSLNKAGRPKSVAVPPPKGSNLKDPAGEREYARLRSRTKGRDFDTDPSLVHKKSPLDYIPPDER